jgi:hypothetical protein
MNLPVGQRHYNSLMEVSPRINLTLAMRCFFSKAWPAAAPLAILLLLISGMIFLLIN